MTKLSYKSELISEGIRKAKLVGHKLLDYRPLTILEYILYFIVFFYIHSVTALIIGLFIAPPKGTIFKNAILKLTTGFIVGIPLLWLSPVVLFVFSLWVLLHRCKY